MKSWQKQTAACQTTTRLRMRKPTTPKTTFPMILIKKKNSNPANQSHDRLRQWRHTRLAFTHAKRSPAELQSEDEVFEFINAD